MKKSMRLFLILLIVSVLAFSVAMAAESVSFSFKDRTTSCWGTSGSIQRAGNNWNIEITSITNHGVGRVFRESDYAWGSGLYTYGPNTTGKRAAKKYTGIGGSDVVVWRMRQDTDYSGAFSCSGVFYP